MVVGFAQFLSTIYLSVPSKKKENLDKKFLLCFNLSIDYLKFLKLDFFSKEG